LPFLIDIFIPQKFLQVRTMGGSKSKLEPLAATLGKVPGGANSLMGYWYVAACVPTFLEKGVVNSLEHYEWTNKDEQKLKVTFKYNSSPTSKQSSIFQDGVVVNKDTGAEWTVRPRLFNGNIPLPIWLPYIVLETTLTAEADKSYMIVGMPDRSYLWIMFRDPNFDLPTLEKLEDKSVNVWGYEKEKIVRVPQKWSDEYPRTDPSEWVIGSTVEESAESKTQ
jgi:apolipoprotein D and lipocalin family protein